MLYLFQWLSLQFVFRRKINANINDMVLNKLALNSWLAQVGFGGFRNAALEKVRSGSVYDKICDCKCRSWVFSSLTGAHFSVSDRELLLCQLIVEPSPGSHRRSYAFQPQITTEEKDK